MNIGFFFKPERLCLNNNKPALNNSNFGEEAILDLERKGLIARCREVPHVVKLLTVSIQSNRKKRLILNLREHLWKETVKFEDLKTALLYVWENHRMFKFDITSAYHHDRHFPCAYNIFGNFCVV